MTTEAAKRPHRPNSVQLRVSDEELAFLNEEAVRRDMSVSAVLRAALRLYVDEKGDDE